MKALETLDYHLKNRARELVRLKEQGQKIIGCYPGGYVPEEIILACGAVPVGLSRRGEHEPVQIAGAYLPRSWPWRANPENIFTSSCVQNMVIINPVPTKAGGVRGVRPPLG